MRSGLSTIQQTLTPEAANVLNRSIAEAASRSHGQTTPLHVAATLLSSPSSYLRQACIRSHPNSSHPLQCRALELCFSVALERLPTGQPISSAPPISEPPISNALMAALKRAQAHQRRGCPEQQQQPLLAVKVELEQLIISILDDPSVSRVMREASFSSPAVKATIEQSLNSSSSNVNSNPSIRLGFRGTVNTVNPSRNMYLNPRLQQGGASQTGQQQRADDVKKVVDILLRAKKRNPILVGESEPEAVLKELLRRIEYKEIGEGVLKNVEVVHLEKEQSLSLDRTQISGKIAELGGLLEGRMMAPDGVGMIVDLGDLKWLVEDVGFSGSMAEAGRVVVAEMRKLVARFCNKDGGAATKLWLIGIASCETYLRCQVYHSSMENDWDLQALPIAARALPGMFPRLGTNGVLGNPLESLMTIETFPTAMAASSWRVSENSDPTTLSCCPQCMKGYEEELNKLRQKDSNKSLEIKLEGTQSPLPQWLQNAKVLNSDVRTSDQSQAKDQVLILRQKTQELQKKWNATCSQLHPHFHHPPGTERNGSEAHPRTNFYNLNQLGRQFFQPNLQRTRSLGETIQLNPDRDQLSIRAACSLPVSPVETELVLGQRKTCETTIDNGECTKFVRTLDADSFKRILKGLSEKVWWQLEAASAIATTVTLSKLDSGHSKRQASGSKGDTWLLFTGPDRIGKRKMAMALSELLSGTNPVFISLGSRSSYEEETMNFRGKTVLDRVAEAIRKNPFSIILLEDIDEADIVIYRSLEQAIERGRLLDSHGREIGLGNVILILTTNRLPEPFKTSESTQSLDEEKVAKLASGDWQLRFRVAKKTGKRKANWLLDEEDSKSARPRKEISSVLEFDLNEAADEEVDRAGGSRNSSDLTTDHEDEHLRSISISQKFLDSFDGTVMFKPADILPIGRQISTFISASFSAVVRGGGISLKIQDEALERIVAGVWLSRATLEEWIEKVMVPSFHQLKTCLPRINGGASSELMEVHLEISGNSGGRSVGDWLPSEIRVVVDWVGE